MEKRKKIIVIGTGAGGAAAAEKLSEKHDVTILEAGGKFHPLSLPVDTFAGLRKTGLFLDERMIRTLMPNMVVRKSDTMIMVNGTGVGGTTTLATGNAVRADGHLKALGLDLDAEFEELCSRVPVTTEHRTYWNTATRELFRTFEGMGLEPQVTPKFLKQARCANCGHCAVGCPAGIKWDTRELIDAAVAKGAGLITNCKVTDLEIEGGEVQAVNARRGVNKVRYEADMVVLAAGGFGTPVILENSGILCEKTLFVDPVLCVAAVHKGFDQSRQLLMPFYSSQDGYMLSPYMDYLSFFFNKEWRYPMRDIISLMIKMSDDSLGDVDGRKINKPMTSADRARLSDGVGKCIEILGRMGISRKDIFLGTLNAGHPGGMLPLSAQTVAGMHDPALPENLYVADATILPRSAGMPPILTIMAMALRIARIMDEA